MARPSKAFRWPRALAEALLLAPALLAGPVHAADASAGNAAGAVLGAAEPSLAGAKGQDVYLDVTLNGAARGLVHFGDRAGQLWASAASLRALGFVLPAGGADPVALHDLAGLQQQYDRALQRVTLTAPLTLLKLPETTLTVPGIEAQPVSAAPGLLLNYDLYGTRSTGTGGAGAFNAFTELRAFGRWGVVSSTQLARSNHGSVDAQQQPRTVRLDTGWSQSWPERLLTVRVGDTLTQALPWTRATRIGGIQIGSNFALQPYLSTTPVPSLLGSATLPSQLDLYVNGMRQYNGQVPAGPFQLNTLPSISGAGNAQVVLTDAFGRSTTLNFSLYGTQQLLKPGLTSWSVELGRVRQNYGLVSNDYGHDPMLSGSWRRGWSDSLTVAAHAEATRGLANVGAGAAGLLGNAGVLNGALAASSGTDRHGTQLNLGYNWNNERFNVGLTGTRTQGQYRDVAALSGALLARASGTATVGYNAGEVGSFSLSYLYQNYPGQAASRYVSAGWFKSLGRQATLSLTANRDLTDRKLYSVFLNVSWALDGRTSASTDLQRDNAGTQLTASASRSTPSDGGWGWNTQLRQGGGQHGAQGEVNYQGPYGRYAAGANVVNGASTVYGDANGALVFMGGHLFAARQIYDAFALVSTDGVPGVPVRLENRPIGSTDASGHLLVTPLNAYQNNKLGINPMDLPADLRIARVDAIATPPDRAGTLVEFGIAPMRAALVSLVDAAGQPLPLGSRVTVNGQAGNAVVGYDGEVYLDTLAATNQLTVQTPEGHCTARFEHHKQSDGGIPRIGPLTCKPEATR
ncbi:MAG: fimbrial biogenesis outer membrane usher protein [Proteobacteria bacterium]|nr:fimbrial biogenesis outer membrane usher protein [Pseudomonadota bacterium]